MKITGFGIANYRSFGSQGAWLSGFGKINILIGKNNCGKSNVLRFLRLIPKNEKPGKFSFDTNSDYHKGVMSSLPLLGVEFQFDDEVHSQSLVNAYDCDDPKLKMWINPSNGVLVGPNPLEPLETNPLVALFRDISGRTYHSTPSKKQALRDTTQSMEKNLRGLLVEKFKNLIYIPAIREIRMTDGKNKEPTELSGQNIIRELRTMQHPLVGEENRQEEYQRIQKFVGDLIDVHDLVMEIPAAKDDIYLNMHGNRLPLSHYGTGIHELVIICSALALHHDHVVCIEEPEIHLHPALLRKFLRFLLKTDNRYFISTHSNVFLDADPSVQVFHVNYDGICSSIDRKETNEHSRAILRDLSYRASDLLQTNGIIWVEGPSDRVYINKWLSLAGSKFVEGVHYSIMFYGGSLLANLSLTDGPAEDLIELLRINQNAIVVIDRDGASSQTAIRKYKKRVQDEIGQNRCWITKGREIENYLRPEYLFSYFEQRYPGKVSKLSFGENDRIQDAINAAVKKKPTPNYDGDKPGYSRRFRTNMTVDDLDILDLKTWIKRVLTAIEEWNNDD